MNCLKHQVDNRSYGFLLFRSYGHFYLYLALWFFIYSVLWILSTRLACKFLDVPFSVFRYNQAFLLTQFVSDPYSIFSNFCQPSSHGGLEVERLAMFKHSLCPTSVDRIPLGTLYGNHYYLHSFRMEVDNNVSRFNSLWMCVISISKLKDCLYLEKQRRGSMNTITT